MTAEVAPSNRRRRILIALLAVLALVALLLWPRTLDALRLQQARAALHRRDAETALRWLAKSAAARPTQARTQLLIARAERHLGRTGAFREHLERAFELGCDPQLVEREQWLMLAQQGELQSTESQLTHALADPQADAREICEALVSGYLRNYRHGDALHLIEAWQGDFPRDEQPLFFRGRVWEHMLLLKKAAEQYRAALKLAPQRQDIRRALAAVVSGLHEYDEAHRLYAECYAADPQDVDMLLDWANCHLATGNERQARQLLEEARQLDADNLQLQIALGQLNISAGKPEQALQTLQAAHQQDPANPLVRHQLGTALQMLGRGEEAKPHLQYAQQANQALARVRKLMDIVQENPRSVEERHQIGTTLIQYGSLADGLAWLASVLQLDPDHQQTHAALADAYQRQGRQPLADKHRRLAQRDTGAVSGPSP